MEEMEPVKDKKTKRKLIIIIIIILLFISCIVGTYIIKRNMNKDLSPSFDKELELDPGQKKGDGDFEKPQAVVGEIAIQGFSKIIIDKDTQKGKANFVNSEVNKCYFECKLTLDKTGEVLYESKMISPGSFIGDIELNKPLAEGTYPATVKYSTYDAETLKPNNGAEVKVNLVVQ